MEETYSTTTIKELAKLLEKDLKVSIATKNYTDALDEIFCFSNTCNANLIEGTSNEQIEEILSRSYQDHSESRAYLNTLILKDLSKALDFFEKLSIQTVHILVGSFKNADSTETLWHELHVRIHLGEDVHIKYLLSVVLQLITKFDVKFSTLQFLIKELGMRIREPEVKSLTLIIFSQLEQKYKDEFSRVFLSFTDELIIEAEADFGTDPLAIIISLLNALYPVLTVLCSRVFLSPSLRELFRERAIEELEHSFSKSLLQLLSIACIDENIRREIAESYIQVLENALSISDYRCLSALVLVKIWSFTKLQQTSIDDLCAILVKAVEDDILEETNDLDDTAGEVNDNVSNSLEGLAYLSLKPSVKVMLRKNAKFCNSLVRRIESQKVDPKFYGVLVVLANLGVCQDETNDSNGTNPKSLKDLKAYSDLKKPSDDGTNVVESKEDISTFNEQYIINTEVLSSIKAVEKELTLGSKEQQIRIIYNITRDKKFVSESIKKGCTTSVLEYLANNITKKNEPVRLLALRSLTRMLIYTDPSLIFNKYSSVNALPFLFELLPTEQTAEEAVSNLFDRELITITDSFESLLALTNLASAVGTDGEDICKRITGNNHYWSIIENLILDDNVILQRSTLELLGNLMSHPMPIAAKFFNFENTQSVKNFNILVKLLKLKDVQSQRAVAAFFANVANSIPFIANELLSQNELITTAIDVFNEQMEDTELRQRFIILFYSLYAVVPETEISKLDSITKNEKYVKALKLALELNDMDSEYMEVVPILLSKC